MLFIAFYLSFGFVGAAFLPMLFKLVPEFAELGLPVFFVPVIIMPAMMTAYFVYLMRLKHLRRAAGLEASAALPVQPR